MGSASEVPSRAPWVSPELQLALSSAFVVVVGGLAILACVRSCCGHHPTTRQGRGPRFHRAPGAEMDYDDDDDDDDDDDEEAAAVAGAKAAMGNRSASQRAPQSRAAGGTRHGTDEACDEAYHEGGGLQSRSSAAVVGDDSGGWTKRAIRPAKAINAPTAQLTDKWSGTAASTCADASSMAPRVSYRTKGRPIKVFVELDGAVHVLRISMQPVESVEDLSRAITTACIESAAPELRDLDFTRDAGLALQYLDDDDAAQPVREETPIGLLKCAKAMRAFRCSAA